jgi:hypothetical protein
MAAKDAARAKDGGAGLRFDVVAMREELDLMTRTVSGTAAGQTLPEARFSTLVGMHIRGARAAIPMSAEETEQRIRSLVDEEIAKAFSDTE